MPDSRPPGSPARLGASAGERRTVSVQAVFHDVDPDGAQRLAAEMIARAHELANRPDCECDVDVSVQSAPEAAPPVREC